ncbi:MAG: hypothetical protein R2867_05330 [Caldilineaceae bacterium]
MNERIREKNHLRWQRNRRKREIEAQKPAIANKVATRLFGGKAATIRVSAPRDPDRERREQIARDLDPKRSTPRPPPQQRDIFNDPTYDPFLDVDDDDDDDE